MKKPMLALGLACAACSDDFSPGSLVDKARVLAVRADTPFALPGSQVQLTALAYDPGGRELQWGWGTCEAPSSSSPVECVRATAFERLQIGTDLTTHTLTVPDTRATSLGVVVIACPGNIERGRTETLPVVCRDARGDALPLSEFEIGLKRIFLRDSSLNQNPAITAVMLAGEDWPEQPAATLPCTDDRCREFEPLRIELRADGASERSVDAAGLPITEQSVLQFYATAGAFDDDLKLASAGRNTWRARREDAGKLVRFWFVVRDDRGGVSWAERTLQVPARSPGPDAR